MLILSTGVIADPPSRVGRLGYTTDAVTFSPAGEDDWFQASLNRPLTTGDRLWSDDGGRAEIQFGGAIVRMDAGTGVSLLNLDEGVAQLELSEGTLNVRVRRLEPNEVFEIDTPNLAFVIRERGEYRIEVDPRDNATLIFARDGRGEAYGEGASYLIDARQPYRFTGTDLGDYQIMDARRDDDFDHWSDDRDRGYDDSPSLRYVSQDVVGYQDLDSNGSWQTDPSYGNVWAPSHVPAGWAPYRDGHWAWVDPWGWTWIDDAPWGFAVSHYGRWAYGRDTWFWVPGPVATRAYYAPALVVFIGAINFGSHDHDDGVAWFPLGPREVYRPSYHVSRPYFENLNRSNTVINNTTINNYYDNSNVTNVVYANRKVRGAVVAVPTNAFVQSQPVSRAALAAPREVAENAPVAFAPPVAPTENSLHGAARHAGKPASRAFERAVVARNKPADQQVGFAAQQQKLAAQPGKPLDDTERQQLRPAAPGPNVKVVAQAQTAAPTTRPAKTERSKPADSRYSPTPQNAERAEKAPADSAAATTPRAVAPTPEPDAAEPKPGPSQAAAPVDPRPAPHKQQNRAQQAKPVQPGPVTAPEVSQSEPASAETPETEPAAQQHNKGAQHARPAAPTPDPSAIEPKPAPSQTNAAAPQATPHRQQGHGQSKEPVEPTPPPAAEQSPAIAAVPGNEASAATQAAPVTPKKLTEKEKREAQQQREQQQKQDEQTRTQAETGAPPDQVNSQ